MLFLENPRPILDVDANIVCVCVRVCVRGDLCVSGVSGRVCAGCMRGCVYLCLSFRVLPSIPTPCPIPCLASLLSVAPLDATHRLSVCKRPILTRGPLRRLADLPLAADWLSEEDRPRQRRPPAPRPGPRKRACSLPSKNWDDRPGLERIGLSELMARFSPARRGRRGRREGGGRT